LATHVAAAPGDLRETLAAIFVRPCVDSVGVSRDAGGPRNPCPSPAPKRYPGVVEGGPRRSQPTRAQGNPHTGRDNEVPSSPWGGDRQYSGAYLRWLKKATGRDRSSRWSRPKTAQPATTGPSIPESAPEARHQRRRYALALVSLSPGSRARVRRVLGRQGPRMMETRRQLL